LVGFIEPDFGGGSMFNLTILAVAAGGTDRDTATLGIEQANIMAENGAQFGDFGGILTLFSNGEIGLATLYHQEPIFFAMDGLPAEFVMPSEGAYPVTAWMTMPKNIPDNRKAAAEQFMSYVLSPEAQVAIAEGIFSAPINGAVELEADLAAMVHPYGEAEAATMMVPDWEYTIENLEDWIDLWNREVQQ
jgi:putative spermidine/putrescine transport system substrate-binding protein